MGSFYLQYLLGKITRRTVRIHNTFTTQIILLKYLVLPKQITIVIRGTQSDHKKLILIFIKL